MASPGTAAGLVWTSVGGKVQYIECICVGAGRGGTPGQLTLTGALRCAAPISLCSAELYQAADGSTRRLLCQHCVQLVSCDRVCSRV